MIVSTTTKLLSLFSPARITGPIFEKELRVASRRKRTYLLRLIYLLAITVFIGIVWAGAYDSVVSSRFNGFGVTNILRTQSIQSSQSGPSSLQIAAQMARAGKMIITNIALFQFYTMPVLAVILLSSSISDEIRGKTIGVLVSTPITSFQIVMGKLLSKLYQLILLMAISVPILSMVRVFGGVQMGYIISTFCVTLTLTIFAASLSLFFSIYIKKPFVVIPLTIILILTLCAIGRWLWRGTSIEPLQWVGISLNPYTVIQVLNDRWSRLPSKTINIVWLSHCGGSLLFSTVILFFATRKVRKVALMEVSGELSPLKRWLNTESNTQIPSDLKTTRPKKEKPIRSVSNNPVIWREARSPIFVKRKFLRILAVLLVSVGSVAAFFIGLVTAIMDRGDYLQTYIVGFMIYGAIFTVIFPASCIPAEKESRSWVMLMSTSLSDWQILTGKFVGILRKCLLPWSLLILFIIYTSVLQLTHPITILFIILNIISVIVLLSGTGLFFGTVFRKANTAVVANIFLAALVWAIIPFVCDFLGRTGNEIQDLCLAMNPFYEAGVVMDLVNFRGGFNTLEYRWPMDHFGVGMTLLTITISTTFHTLTGVFFILCAKKRLRKNIFSI